MKCLDPDELTSNENYRIMTTVTAPRPIGWISTVDGNGVNNLAPFSHYNNICTTVPIVMFSVDPKDDGRIKDTLINIKETEEFVVNGVNESLVIQMEKTAENIPANMSEFEYADIEYVESESVAPRRVADSPFHMECSMYDLLNIYDRTVVLGEVVRFHTDEDMLTHGKVDVEKLDVVGRLGGKKYTKVRPIDYDNI